MRSGPANRSSWGFRASSWRAPCWRAASPREPRLELASLDAEPTRVMLDLAGAHGWVLLVEAQLALGELDGAQDVAVRALERAEAASLPQQVAAARCARAKVTLARGRPPRRRQGATPRGALSARAIRCSPRERERWRELPSRLRASARRRGQSWCRRSQCCRRAVLCVRPRPPRRRCGVWVIACRVACEHRTPGSAWLGSARASARSPTGSLRERQPAGGRGAVSQRGDRRESPRADLRQARRALAGGARGGRRPRGGSPRPRRLGGARPCRISRRSPRCLSRRYACH